jgi:hypothetical protein
MRDLLCGRATVSQPTQLRSQDLALGIVLKNRVLKQIKTAAEEGSIGGIGGMTYFLGTRGWYDFSHLRNWILSTGCAQDIHLYDDVECLCAGRIM